jgi:hypothetical protein
MAKYIFVVLDASQKGTLIGSFLDGSTGKVIPVRGSNVSLAEKNTLYNGGVLIVDKTDVGVWGSIENIDKFLAGFGWILAISGPPSSTYPFELMTIAEFEQAKKEMDVAMGKIPKSTFKATRGSSLHQRFVTDASMVIDTNLIKAIFKALVKFREGGWVVWDDESIWTAGGDSQHAIGQILSLSKNDCNEYKASSSPVVFGLNFSDMNKILKRIKGESIKKNKAPRRAGMLGEKVAKEKKKGARGELVAPQLRLSIDTHEWKIGIEPIRATSSMKTMFVIKIKELTEMQRDEMRQEAVVYQNMRVDLVNQGKASMQFNKHILTEIKNIKPSDDKFLFVQFDPNDSAIHAYADPETIESTEERRASLISMDVKTTARKPFGNIFGAGYFVDVFNNLIFNLGKNDPVITVVMSPDKPIVIMCAGMSSQIVYMIAHRVASSPEEESEEEPESPSEGEM